MSSHYETDEFEDVVSSLRILRSSIASDNIEEIEVKWAVVATHSALQGACVCLLTRTDGGGALQSGKIGGPENHEERWLYYLSFQTQKRMCENAGIELVMPEPDYSPTRMASLRELAKRLPEVHKFNIAKDGKWPGDIESQDFTRIYRWRNEFTHFPPQNWSIELVGLPRILRTAVSKVEEISSSNHFRRRNKFPDTQIADVIASIRVRLSTLQKILDQNVT